MKMILSLIATAVCFASAARAEDGRILTCTVDFKSKGGMTSLRTQSNSWLLPVDKGSVKLDSLGKVKIVLSKKIVNDKPLFRLTVKDGEGTDTELNVGYHGFDIALPITAHVPDGEDGSNYDQVRITCDSGYAAG